MIIKHKDDNQDDIDYLSDLLERDLPDNKKNLIDRALKNLYPAKEGGDAPAYYLDQVFKSARNWCLIHDLRIEMNGEFAQFDHLIIGRMMDVYVIESKNFTSGVSISDDGKFSYLYKDKNYAITSPIEENETDIKLLKKFLIESDLLPMRLGVKLEPRFRNIVLVSPKAELTKPKKGFYDCSAAMKADKFLQRFTDDFDNEDRISDMASIAKVISQESLQRFSEKVVLHHKPANVNYKIKFALDDGSDLEISEAENDPASEAPNCPVCGKSMVLREAKQGKNEGKKFWGCQQFPKCRGVLELENKDIDETPVAGIDSETDSEPEPLCPKCNSPMVRRVSKKGKNAGKEFWGCKDFPNCRGVVSIE